MSDTLKIQSTRDYDLFKFINCNRSILPYHVERLASDTCFPEKYMYSPIVVDKHFGVIDGQHRLIAAKSLGLPIYYIQDYGGSLDDIKVRNTLQVTWKQKDYVEFYKEVNTDCKFIYELQLNNGCSYSFLFAAIEKFFSKLSGRGRCLSFLKEGKFELDHNKEKFKEFVEIVSARLKLVQSYKGQQAARPFFKNVVTSALAHYYLTNRNLFDKIVYKMPTTSFQMPFCGTYETARETLKRLASHKETSVAKPVK